MNSCSLCASMMQSLPLRTNRNNPLNNRFVKNGILVYACLFGLTVNVSSVVGQVAMQKQAEQTGPHRLL